MQLSKVTSWGLIIGGLWFVLGFMIVGISLDLADDKTPAEELKIAQDNTAFLALFGILFAAVFAYLAKSILQVAEAVKVSDEWFMYARILLITMLALLLANLAMFMLIPEETTVESFTAMDHISQSLSNMTNVLSGLVFLIIAGFVFKNGAGNVIFKVLIAILALLAIVDFIGLLDVIDLDDGIGFVTWILWGVSLLGIGVLGLTTKEA
tara:strand:+ start:248 stop:874 length:627 start_codon:yes stop_codon:yes gene_type:complete